MDLPEWLAAEHADAVDRLRRQVLDLVPTDRRAERPGGGNSVLYACFHVARHAELALAAITGELGSGLVPEGPAGSAAAGIEEDEPDWAASLEPGPVEGYLLGVLNRVAGALGDGLANAGELERVPDTAEALRAAGIPDDRYGWLYRMWVGQPVAFLVRWPLLGHVANHTGEMIATRNRMGLSPF